MPGLNFKYRFYLLLLVLLSCISRPAEATHSMGADLTYTCLGGNNYRLRLSFYRDCYGIDAPFNVDIRIFSASCGYDYYEIANPIPGTGQEITPICPAEQSTCTGGTFTGIQEWIYEADITLPGNCSDWEFSYQLCCRNGAITTIDQPLSNDIYVYSMLNNTNGICNNSPTFANEPVPFICLGQQFCFNHGTSDVDGDSLVYTPITPFNAPGSNVVYLAPYSATQSLNSIPAATFNTATGDFCVNPQSLEVTVMAVLVSEYRNGILIGQVERDIQITVMNCTNLLPALSGINGTNSFSSTACANSSFCFNVFSSDPDAGQNLSVTWDSTINGASFSQGPGTHPTGTFCWTPQQSDVSNTPRCFTVMVKDDACPYRGSQVYSFCITVVNAGVNAGADQSILCNTQALLTATPTGNLTGISYLWNTGATTSSISAGTGTYVVTATSALCYAKDTVKVTSPDGPTAEFTTSTGCSNSPVGFTDQSFGNFPITQWNWSFGDGGISSDTFPVHQYPAIGTYTVQLIVQSGLCIDTLIRPVTVQPGPSAVFNATPACPGQPVNIVNNSTGSSLDFLWTNGNGITKTDQVPAFTYPSGGNYTLSLTVTDSAGCSDSISQPLLIPADPAGSIQLPQGPLCEGNNFQISGSSNATISSWSWNIDNLVSASGQQVQFAFSGGTHTIELIVLSSDGCRDTVLSQITVQPPFIAPSVNSATICKGDSATLIATGGSSYSWNNGSTSHAVQVTPFSTTNYTVTITNAAGCTDTTTATVNILPLPSVFAGNDVSVCSGDTTDLSAIGAVDYIWSDGSTASLISVSPAQTSVYTVTGTAANGCTNSDTVLVTVNNNPAAAFTAGNSCISKPVIFTNASTGNLPLFYTWNFGDTTSAAALHPQHQYHFPGTYPVQLLITDVNGCSGSVIHNLIIKADPVVNIQSVSDPGCYFNVTTYTYTGSDNFTALQWNDGNGNLTSQSSLQLTYYEQGNYSANLEAVTAEGCTARAVASVFAEIWPLPMAAFRMNDNPQQFYPVFFDNRSLRSDSYKWDFGDGSTSVREHPQHIYKETGKYQVELIAMNTYGCRDTAYEYIELSQGWMGWIPNAFTPDNNGINDIFMVYGHGIADYEMNIYNRWGAMIYKGSNQGWNGLLNSGNEEAQQDVYVYEIRITDVNGNVHERAGRVSLIR